MATTQAAIDHVNRRKHRVEYFDPAGRLIHTYETLVAQTDSPEPPF